MLRSIFMPVFAIGFVTSSMALAPAAQGQIRADRVEDRLDRREDRIDRSVNNGPLDRIEDRFDRAENRVDRRTGPYAPAVSWHAPVSNRVVVAPRPIARTTVVVPRVRTVRGVRVARYYGPTIPGYGFHYADNDAYPWIAFTAISLKLLDVLSEPQVRYHEEAQIMATSASIGETISWNHEGASGQVTAVRQGNNASGNICREFQQTLYFNGQAEDAWVTTCQDPSGNWAVLK